MKWLMGRVRALVARVTAQWWLWKTAVDVSRTIYAAAEDETRPVAMIQVSSMDEVKMVMLAHTQARHRWRIRHRTPMPCYVERNRLPSSERNVFYVYHARYIQMEHAKEKAELIRRGRITGVDAWHYQPNWLMDVETFIDFPAHLRVDVDEFRADFEAANKRSNQLAAARRDFIKAYGYAVRQGKPYVITPQVAADARAVGLPVAQTPYGYYCALPIAGRWPEEARRDA
jgi:hypothetical protein